MVLKHVEVGSSPKDPDFDLFVRVGRRGGDPPNTSKGDPGMSYRCLRNTRPSEPYTFIGFGALDVTRPYEFIGFGDIHGPKPYEFTGFGMMRPGRIRIASARPVHQRF